MSQDSTPPAKPDSLAAIVERVQQAFQDVTPEEIRGALARDRGPDDNGKISRFVTIDGFRMQMDRTPSDRSLGECTPKYARKIRQLVDGFQAKRKHRRKKDDTHNDVLFHLRKAIEEKGRTARPDEIISAAGVSNQAGREGLRELEALGEYAGFARKKPGRYKP